MTTQPITFSKLPSKDLFSTYQTQNTIGKGTFSKVKLGYNKRTNEKVAIKILDKTKITSKSDLERINREISFLKKFKHTNIIKIYDIKETSNNYYIFMEYCEKGELFHYIVQKRKIEEKEASYFFYQLINGLEYIHANNIVHRDLKPENLLLGKGDVLKIIDFGLSNYYEGRPLHTPCGSPCYASPEMLAGKKYNGFCIDIWSTGIILFAMICGYLPFEDKDNDALFRKIMHGELKFPSFISEHAKDLICKILITEPSKRIKLEEIKNHSFYLMGKNDFMHRHPEMGEVNLGVSISSMSNKVSVAKTMNVLSMKTNKNSFANSTTNAKKKHYEVKVGIVNRNNNYKRSSLVNSHNNNNNIVNHNLRSVTVDQKNTFDKNQTNLNENNVMKVTPKYTPVVTEMNTDTNRQQQYYHHINHSTQNSINTPINNNKTNFNLNSNGDEKQVIYKSKQIVFNFNKTPRKDTKIVNLNSGINSNANSVNNSNNTKNVTNVSILKTNSHDKKEPKNLFPRTQQPQPHQLLYSNVKKNNKQNLHQNHMKLQTNSMRNQKAPSAKTSTTTIRYEEQFLNEDKPIRNDNNNSNSNNNIITPHNKQGECLYLTTQNFGRKQAYTSSFLENTKLINNNLIDSSRRLDLEQFPNQTKSVRESSLKSNTALNTNYNNNNNIQFNYNYNSISSQQTPSYHFHPQTTNASIQLYDNTSQHNNNDVNYNFSANEKDPISQRASSANKSYFHTNRLNRFDFSNNDNIPLTKQTTSSNREQNDSKENNSIILNNPIIHFNMIEPKVYVNTTTFTSPSISNTNENNSTNLTPINRNIKRINPDNNTVSTTFNNSTNNSHNLFSNSLKPNPFSRLNSNTQTQIKPNLKMNYIHHNNNNIITPKAIISPNSFNGDGSDEVIKTRYHSTNQKDNYDVKTKLHLQQKQQNNEYNHNNNICNLNDSDANKTLKNGIHFLNANISTFTRKSGTSTQQMKGKKDWNVKNIEINLFSDDDIIKDNRGGNENKIKLSQNNGNDLYLPSYSNNNNNNINDNYNRGNIINRKSYTSSFIDKNNANQGFANLLNQLNNQVKNMKA